MINLCWGDRWILVQQMSLLAMVGTAGVDVLANLSTATLCVLLSRWFQDTADAQLSLMES